MSLGTKDATWVWFFRILAPHVPNETGMRLINIIKFLTGWSGFGIFLVPKCPNYIKNNFILFLYYILIYNNNNNFDKNKIIKNRILSHPDYIKKIKINLFYFYLIF